jgi:hypothetical protein
MAKAELKEHAENIQANGLIAPIIIWKENDKSLLLDGRNRLDALALVGMLGVDDRGILIDAKSGDVIFQTYRRDGDGDPYEIALSLNVHRRHLNAEQKRQLIAKVLKAKPATSNRQIASIVKADDKTVASVRSVMESTAEIPQLEKTKGKDGKARPVKAKKKSTIPPVSPVPPVPIKAASLAAPEAKPAIPTKATDLARIADLARDCRGLLMHPEQNADEIRKKLSQIIKLSDPNSKGRGTKSAASNAKLDQKLFRRAMALETEEAEQRKHGGDPRAQSPGFCPALK